MRLINTKTLELKQFNNNIPKYAILSHTWDEPTEVSFADWKDLDKARAKDGFRKIDLACQQARLDGYEWAWVDTNCIDKSSSSELSEAINSMYAWYRDAEVCYVFMKDVEVDPSPASSGVEERKDEGGKDEDGKREDGKDNESRDAKHQNERKKPENTIPNRPPQNNLADPRIRDAFETSVWFSRGWTLQELLAPSKVIFYSREWLFLATKDDTETRVTISDITSIDKDYLREPSAIYSASVAHRISWMAQRTTTRIEDTAYCLLGLFGIHMALLYGEGHRAFERLQEEIIRVSNDQTIFCWQASVDSESRRSSSSSSSLLEDVELSKVTAKDPHRQAELKRWTSILAPDPRVFRRSAVYSSDFGNTSVDGPDKAGSSAGDGIGPYSVTNFGLSISLPLLYTAWGACAVLDVRDNTAHSKRSRVVIPLHRVQSGHYIRISTQLLMLDVPPKLTTNRTRIFIDCRNAPSSSATSLLSQRFRARPISFDKAEKYTVLFMTFSQPVDINVLVKANADFVPFHSAIEIIDRRLESRSFAVMDGTTASDNSFHLLIGGRSVIEDDSGDMAFLKKHQLSLPAYVVNEHALASIDWHVDVWGQALPSTTIWDDIGLDFLASSIPPQYFGSWCSSPALRNVLSWPYAPGGALVCYLDLGELHRRTPIASVNMSDSIPMPSENGQYARLRHNEDASILKQMYQMLG